MVKKPKKGRTKDRASSESRLLDAAKKVFSEKGFSAATTRAIAREADVNLALIVRYFKNKYGLFSAVIERDLRKHINSALPYPPCKTFLEECLTFTKNRFCRHTAEIEYWRIVVGQFVTDSKFVRKFQDASLIQSDVADFEKRLIPHFKKIKVTDVKEVRKFAQRIEINIAAAVFFNIIIAGISQEEALKDLLQFVEEYCKMVYSL